MLARWETVWGETTWHRVTPRRTSPGVAPTSIIAPVTTAKASFFFILSHPSTAKKSRKTIFKDSLPGLLENMTAGEENFSWNIRGRHPETMGQEVFLL